MKLIWLLIPLYFEIQLIGYSQSIKLHLRRNLMEDLALISFREFPFHSKKPAAFFFIWIKFKRKQHDFIFTFKSFESWKRFSFLRQTIAQKIITFLEKISVELTGECNNSTCKTFLQKYSQQGSVFFMFQNICLVLPRYGLIARRVGVLEMKKRISWERLTSVKFQTTFNNISTKTSYLKNEYVYV